MCSRQPVRKAALHEPTATRRSLSSYGDLCAAAPSYKTSRCIVCTCRWDTSLVLTHLHNANTMRFVKRRCRACGILPPHISLNEVSSNVFLHATMQRRGEADAQDSTPGSVGPTKYHTCGGQMRRYDSAMRTSMSHPTSRPVGYGIDPGNEKYLHLKARTESRTASTSVGSGTKRRHFRARIGVSRNIAHAVILPPPATDDVLSHGLPRETPSHGLFNALFARPHRDGHDAVGCSELRS